MVTDARISDGNGPQLEVRNVVSGKYLVKAELRRWLMVADGSDGSGPQLCDIFCWMAFLHLRLVRSTLMVKTQIYKCA